jgi:hypothetical protein
MSIIFEWKPHVSSRQITRVAVACSLKRLCTTGVDFHPSREKNVENKCIYLRPYRKYDCHSADFLANRTPVTTSRIYGRVAKIQPAVIWHSASSDTAVWCCTSNSALRAHAQTETRIYWGGSYCSTSFVSKPDEWTDGLRNFPRSVFRRVSALYDSLSNPITYRYRWGGIIENLPYSTLSAMPNFIQIVCKIWTLEVEIPLSPYAKYDI